jgi:hypothetical protein
VRGKLDICPLFPRSLKENENFIKEKIHKLFCLEYSRAIGKNGLKLLRYKYGSKFSDCPAPIQERILAVPMAEGSVS